MVIQKILLQLTCVPDGRKNTRELTINQAETVNFVNLMLLSLGKKPLKLNIL